MIEREDLGDGILLLRLNVPGATANVLSRAVNVAFAEAVGAALTDGAVAGAVIASGKADFVTGGDLDELRRLASPQEAAALVGPMLATLRRMETAGKPVVAALNGSALGGGLEIALACHRRIAADNPAARFGLPEATLGLMPGAGGTQRLPRLIGIDRAAPLLLEGRGLVAAEALKLGILDAVVPPGDLMAAAKAWALANPTASQPWDRKGFVAPGFHPQSPEGRQFFTASWPRYRRKGGAHDPAAAAILQVLHHGMERAIDPALAIETRHFARVAASVEAKNKIRTLFYAAKDARARRRPDGKPSQPPARLGIVGGGQMGCGIAFAALRAGMAVALLDVSAERAQAAHAAVARIVARETERGRLDAAAGEALLARLAVGTDYALIGKADLVVEAVFERRDLKREVLAKVAQAAPGAVIASNTSTIPIAGLAEALPEPANLLGLHFFSPVERMELVEAIRAPATSDAAFGAGLDLVRALRKTPVAVNDGLGFFTSRVVTNYTTEALTLLAEGVPAQLIDNVAIAAGMPIGPCAMADLTSLTLLADIVASMRGDGRRTAYLGIRAEEALARLAAAERRGSAADAGI